MKEEYINYLFNWAQSDGFKGNRDEFIKKIQTDDNAYNYVLRYAKNDGYKGSDDDFSIAVGRGAAAPVATTEPAKTEPVKTETVTEPTKELRSEPMTTVKAQALPEKQVATPTVDMAKMPTMQVRSVEAIPTKEEPMTAEKQEVVKSDIESQLLPVTEKTEVKAIETPSDKMVIKSEAKAEVKPTEVAKVEVKEVPAEEPKMKVKGKLKPEPVKIETIKVESEKGPTTVEVPSFAVPEPRKKYKPYGEKGPDVYYSEEYDQYIIKEGDNRTVVNKGSGKYEEIDKKIGETVKGTTEGTGKCDPDESLDSCSKNTLILSDFINNNYDKYEIGWRATSEGKLIHKLNEDKKFFDKDQESMYVRFSDMELEDQNEKDPEIQEINKRQAEFNQKSGQIWYANDEPPKDKRFVIYKPYGDDRTLIYDKESEVILKQIDKAPEVDFSSTRTIYDTKGKVVQEGSNATEFYKNYKKNNPNKGLNVWYGYHKDRPEYKELKSLIDGLNYKKEKGAKNTFVAPPTETQFAPDWLKK